MLLIKFFQLINLVLDLKNATNNTLNQINYSYEHLNRGETVFLVFRT